VIKNYRKDMSTLKSGIQ